MWHEGSLMSISMAQLTVLTVYNRPSYENFLQMFEPIKKDMPFGEVIIFWSFWICPL